MTSTQKIALIYTRVSSLQQQTDGTGNHSQDVRCRELAKKEGWVIEKSFPDTFTGAGDFMKRPAMRELLEHIDNNVGKQYVVIFDDLKRLSRDTKAHIELRLEFKSRNVELKCLNFNFEESPEGEFIETIIAASGQLERKQNQRQVMQKQRARLLDGYWPYRAFYGYDQLKVEGHGKLSCPNDGAVYVKEAFEGYACGRFKTITDVGVFLKEKKVLRRVLVSKVCETALPILKNIFYAGFVDYPKYGVHMVPGKHKALISLDVYDKVQERLEARRNNEREYQIYREDFELRGFVRCIHCAIKLRSYVTSKKRKSGHIQKNYYYECKNKECELGYGKVIRADGIHDKFHVLLQSVEPTEIAMAVSYDAFSEAFEDFKNEIKVGSLHEQGELQEINAQIDHLVEITSKPLPEALLSAYQEKLEKLLVKRKKIEQKVASSIDMEKISRTSYEKFSKLIVSPYSLWDSCLSEKKKELYGYIFQEDFFVGTDYKCRTPVPSPLYQYLKDFSLVCEENKQDVPDLWTA